MMPTRNIIWFPSFKLSILVLLTIIIETGFVVIYCVSQNYVSSEISNLSAIVIMANLITGLVGWMFKNLKGLNNV